VLSTTAILAKYEQSYRVYRVHQWFIKRNRKVSSIYGKKFLKFFLLETTGFSQNPAHIKAPGNGHLKEGLGPVDTINKWVIGGREKCCFSLPHPFYFCHEGHEGHEDKCIRRVRKSCNLSLNLIIGKNSPILICFTIVVPTMARIKDGLLWSAPAHFLTRSSSCPRSMLKLKPGDITNKCSAWGYVHNCLEYSSPMRCLLSFIFKRFQLPGTQRSPVRRTIDING